MSDDDYLTLTKTVKSLPKLNKVKKRSKEIDSLFEINTFTDMIGAWEPLSNKIKYAVEKMYKKYKNEPVPNHIGIKLSGDGTMMGKRIHATNITFRVLYGEYLSEEYILAMVRKPEKHEFLKKIFDPIVAGKPENVTIGDQSVPLKYHLGADMKFINEMMGLGACSSTHSCAWCKCPSDERHINDKKLSMINQELGARTIEEIERLCKGPKKRNMSCLRTPVLPFIPVDCVVPDPLHLFLRISDQLVNQLVQILRHKDNIGKNSKNVDMTNCQNIASFEKFVKDMNIPWFFMTNKDTGLLQFRDFTGPEHKKIQDNIKLENLISWHPKLDNIKWLWEEFRHIIIAMKEPGADSDSVETRSRAWVGKYAETFLAKDVTPYMHVLMNHVAESLKLHGHLNHFSQQAMEKLNDKVTSLFFRATNHRNTEAFVQVMQKQNRIAYLDETCKDGLLFKVHCKMCGEPGHNKRTCYLRHRPLTDVVPTDEA